MKLKIYERFFPFHRGGGRPSAARTASRTASAFNDLSALDFKTIQDDLGDALSGQKVGISIYVTGRARIIP